jgi:co-chaperonin GroES (HSP10)
MKFRPLHDRVVVERIDAEAKTAGGMMCARRLISQLPPILR